MRSSRARMRRALLPDAAAGDPLDAIERAPGEPAFYWRSDERDVEIAALGAVACFDASGPRRFADAVEALARLGGDSDEGARGFPLAVGGFAFGEDAPPSPWEGFPPLRFFVPRVVWMRRHGVRRMVVAYPAPGTETPRELVAAAAHTNGASAEDAASWRRRVEAAVEAIQAGRLEKVVLARRRTVARTAEPALATLLHELAASRPSCFTFLVRWSGRTFIGSSPERLVKLAGREITADALAGTAARGRTPAHDDALAGELTTSAKERAEHRIVADAIRSALAPVAVDVRAPAEPSLVRLPEAHHLHTPVRARLAPASRLHLLELAARLHPTPAVCGSPRKDACRQLAGEEPDRGWYGGALGWIAESGEGELAVALRAALLGSGCAHVWAGAGIVEGSCPDREYDETERKMTSILPYFDERGLHDDPSGGADRAA